MKSHSPQQIIVDYKEANRKVLAGKGNLTKALVETLILKTIHQSIEWHLMIDEDVRYPLSINHVHYHQLKKGWSYHAYLWKSLFSFKRHALFFSPTSYIVASLPLPIKSYVYVHDLVCFKFPHLSHKKAWVERMFAKKAWKKATGILCNSESTKQDLEDHFSSSKEKTTVAYPSSIFFASERTPLVNLPENYFLYLGSIESRKNLANLVKAYEKIASIPNFPSLVLVGQKLWGAKEVEKIIHDSPFRSKIHYFLPVSEKEKLYLIEKAFAFVYPSFYEGFGLPVLEAMELGTPVLTSNISSLPEVAGNAAIYANPYSIQEISNGMQRLFEDQKLRKKLSQNGKKQAANFTWERSAEIVLQCMGL